MNKKNILSLLLLPLLLLTNCTKEDYRNCPAGLYISFEAENSAKYSYPELVAKVDLYFYGTDGELKADLHYTRNELRAHDRAAFVPQLDKGDYRVVAIVSGGMNDDYETSGIEIYETIYTKLKREIITEKLTDLFVSEKQITVRQPGSSVQTEKMTLAKLNNSIRLKIIYDGYTAPAGKTVSVFAEENSGIFYYSTYFSPAIRFVHYMPWAESFGVNELPEKLDLSVFRLFLGSDATITVYETDIDVNAISGRFFKLNIVDELAKVKDATEEYLYNTNEKLKLYDEYEITIKFGIDFVVLSIVIDNWDTIGGGVEV